MKLTKTMAVVAAASLLGLTACGSQTAGTAQTATRSAAQPQVGRSQLGSAEQAPPPASNQQPPASSQQSSGHQSGTSSSAGPVSSSPAANGPSSGTSSNGDDGKARGGVSSAPQTKSDDGKAQAGVSSAQQTKNSGGAGAPVPVPVPSASKESGTTSGPSWPADVCTLMPADVTAGLTKQQGAADLRCMYDATIGGKYHSVKIDHGAFAATAAEPFGSITPMVTGIRKTSVAGRPAWVANDKRGGWGLVLFNTGDESAMVTVADESKSPTAQLAAATALAARIAPKLPK